MKSGHEPVSTRSWPASAQLGEPAPQTVDLASELRLVTRVVDHVGGPGQALLTGDLAGDAIAGVGLVLAAIYEYTRSLYASIGVHFVFNSMSFMLLLLFPDLR